MSKKNAAESARSIRPENRAKSISLEQIKHVLVKQALNSLAKLHFGKDTYRMDQPREEYRAIQQCATIVTPYRPFLIQRPNYLNNKFYNA